MGKYLIILLSILMLCNAVVFAEELPISSYSDNPTPTSIGYPPTNIVFQAHDDVRPNYAPFAPLKDSMCWTWEHLDGYIGPYMVPAGKQLIVIKFTSDQPSIMMHDVICEGPTHYTPWDRANSMHTREPGYYRWDNIVIYYVGDSWTEVTLTPTASITNTPSVTSTSTATFTPSATSTSTVTASNTTLPTAIVTRSRTSTPSRTIPVTSTPSLTFTPTVTETPTPTSTSTLTASNNTLPTATVTRSRTSTPSRTKTPTRSKTPTPTESLGPNVIVPQGVSTLVRPKVGNVCYGEIVGNQARVITEFVGNYNSGVEVSGGGCFTSNSYSLSQILRYLESRGINYHYSSLPKPTLTPSRTLVPTVTIVSHMHIGIQTDKTKKMILQPGTICWGYKVSSFEYKVVKYHKGTNSPIRITKGGCTLSEKLSAEDVYNYLRRRLNLPLNGFVDVR